MVTLGKNLSAGAQVTIVTLTEPPLVGALAEDAYAVDEHVVVRPFAGGGDRRFDLNHCEVID